MFPCPFLKKYKVTHVNSIQKVKYVVTSFSWVNPHERFDNILSVYGFVQVMLKVTTYITAIKVSYFIKR